MFITTEDAIAACNALCARLDAGTTNPEALIEIYDGAPPASITDPVATQKLIVRFKMNAVSAFALATDVPPFAVATHNPIADATALADGTATWFRIKDRDGAVRWQGSVTGKDLGGELQVTPSADIITGTKVTVVSLVARMGKGSI